MDTKLQQHEEKARQEETLIQELSASKNRMDADLASSRDQLRAQEIKASL